MKRSFAAVTSGVDYSIRNTRRKSLVLKKAGVSFSSRQAQEVKKIIQRQGELKFFLGASAGFIPVAVGTTLTGNPFDIPQGQTDSTRIGDALTWCGHIDLRLHVINGQGATADKHNTVRVVIFQWFANQQPFPADLFLAGPSGTSDVLSCYNHDRRHEYAVLFDKSFKTVGNGNVVGTPFTQGATSGCQYFKIPLTKARKNVQYVTAGLTGTNRIYLYFVSDNVLATAPTLAYTTKIVFRDS